MLIVAPIRDELRLALTEEQKKLFGVEKLKLERSQLPAITHVDYSARLQTVHEDTNPRYYKLLKEFQNQTDCGVVLILHLADGPRSGIYRSALVLSSHRP